MPSCSLSCPMGSSCARSSCTVPLCPGAYHRRFNEDHPLAVLGWSLLKWSYLKQPGINCLPQREPPKCSLLSQCPWQWSRRTPRAVDWCLRGYLSRVPYCACRLYRASSVHRDRSLMQHWGHARPVSRESMPSRGHWRVQIVRRMNTRQMREWNIAW